MDSKQNPTTELLNILSRAMDSNTYGSIEIFLEDGEITQITERRIKKLKRTKSAVKLQAKSAAKPQSKNKSSQRKDSEIPVKYQN